MYRMDLITKFQLIILFSTRALAYMCHFTYPPTAIDCSGLGMDSLPEHLKDHIATVLVFSHNKLNSSVTFDEWPDLRSIDVSNNLITNISEDTFKGLINLRVLNISYNGIDTITEDAFNKLEHLEVLDLSGNPYITYDYIALQKLLNETLYRSLKKLVMRSSEVYILPQDFFQYALELQYLDLSHNNITHIPALPKSLMHLDLSYNNITTISIIPFHNTHVLRNILLEFNTQLYDVDINAFETTKNLRNVSFRGCKNLTTLPPYLFYFNKNVTKLSIAECNFKTLPKAYRHTFLRIPSLELEGNPWVCNSSIKWFITLRSSVIDNVRCAMPTNSTITEYYGSKFHHTALRQVLLVLIVIVFILFGTAIYLSFSKEKSRLNTPYLPLHGKHPFHNPVYITTVV